MDKRNFIEEPLLMLACYICDESGNELEYKDYKEKGKTLKIVTEEVLQEVVPNNEKRYDEPALYWDPKVYKDLDTSYTKVTEISLPIPDSNGETMPPVEKKTFVPDYLVKRDLIDEKLEPKMDRFKTSGKFMKVVDGSLSLAENVKLKGVNNYGLVVRRSVYMNNTKIETINPLNPLETITTYMPIPDLGKFTQLNIIDRYGTHDTYVEDPYVEISTPENTRKIQAYESYANKLPSRVYKVTLKEGLDFGINKLIKDPTMVKYTFTKLIISKNVSTSLKHFNNNYSIKESTFKTLFSTFKDVEIENNLLDIIFPNGKLELNSLKLKDCRLLTNNTMVKVNGKLTIENISIRSNGSNIHFTGFSVKDSVKIDSINVTGPSLFNITYEGDDKTKEIALSNVKYTFNNTDKKQRAKPVMTIGGFSKATVTKFDKSTSDILSMIPLKFVNCGKVSIVEAKFGESIHELALILMESGTEFSIMDFDDLSGSKSGTCFNLSKLSSEAKVSLTDCNVNSSRVFSLNSCELGELTITDSTLNLVSSFFKFIGNKEIPKFNINKTKVSFSEDVSIDVLESTMDNVEIVAPNITFNINNNLKLMTSLLKINGNVNLNLVDGAKVNFRETPIACKHIVSMKGKNIASNTTIEMIKSIVEGSEWIISDIHMIDLQLSPIASRKVEFKNITTLKSDESPIRTNIVGEFKTNNIIKSSAVFTMENGGSISLKSHDTYGKLTFITEDKLTTIDREVYNSGVYDKYTGDFKLKVVSFNSLSSAFVVDDVTKFIVSPTCSDFKFFKKINPIEFIESNVGKKLYETIHYGVF